MLRACFVCAACIVAVSPSFAGRHMRVEQISGSGDSKSTEIMAKWSAEHYVHAECRAMGGSVILGSTNIESCTYVGAGYHRCEASCGCKIRY